jgi:hypothetical protein
MQLIINYLVRRDLEYLLDTISVNETRGFVFLCTSIRKRHISYFKPFTGSKDVHNLTHIEVPLNSNSQKNLPFLPFSLNYHLLENIKSQKFRFKCMAMVI